MSKSKKEQVADEVKINDAVESTDEVVELSEVDMQKAKNAQLNETLLRSYAEFDNFKKRTLKEKEEMMIYSKALCLKDILSVVDNFERALAVESKDEEFKKGMEMIFTQLSETITNLGVQEIESLNQTFNPDVHNAINQIEDENFGENTICQVFQKGYKIGERVLRHAMVVVANP
ncbi:MAG: nucleotide exchange factor GrpE [Oscillospiraceae bacterium]